jgi:hypothetical protein
MSLVWLDNPLTVPMAKTKKQTIAEAADRLRTQAAKLAGIAEAYRERDTMHGIDLMDIEANLRQVADILAPAQVKEIEEEGGL